MKHTKSMFINPSHESEELYLYSVNTSRIYERIAQIRENLRKKYNAGKYNRERAIDAFYPVATEAAALYNKEIGKMYFNVTSKYTTAAEIEQRIFDEIEIEAERTQPAESLINLASNYIKTPETATHETITINNI